MLPDSSARELTDSDLRGLSPEELRLARNEVYARHGRVFRDEGLQAYFDAKPWYQSLPKLPLDTDPVLSALEIANVNFIISYEGR
ncbi:MAG: YARHG domain-containing protein [Lachnospiraceae bacterium]|nr:YARHG domain-containing protein [Lachnospiraceae bacterium]